MKLFINGEAITLSDIQTSVEDALQVFLTENQQQQSFAVALNGSFVSKGTYQQTRVNVGDSLDVLFPIQGG